MICVALYLSRTIAQKPTGARLDANQSLIAVVSTFLTLGSTLYSDRKKQSLITSPIISSNCAAVAFPVGKVANSVDSSSSFALYVIEEKDSGTSAIRPEVFRDTSSPKDVITLSWS